MRNERDHVIGTIEAFLTGTAGRRAWDDFTSSPLRDAELNRIRLCAAAVDLPLDLDGQAILRDLLDQAALLDDPARPKPWRMGTGAAVGLAAGALLWWINYRSGAGLFYNLHLIVVPPALGAFLVSLRNSRAQVGVYDPRIVAQNKEGRV